jgi:hypothetical protein
MGWQWQGGSGVIRFGRSARSFWWQFHRHWSSIERDMAVVVFLTAICTVLGVLWVLGGKGGAGVGDGVAVVVCQWHHSIRQLSAVILRLIPSPSEQNWPSYGCGSVAVDNVGTFWYSRMSG